MKWTTQKRWPRPPHRTWHRWFAWRPVVLSEDLSEDQGMRCWVWLETIARRDMYDRRRQPLVDRLKGTEWYYTTLAEASLEKIVE
jgi:hypothetical protein